MAGAPRRRRRAGRRACGPPLARDGGEGGRKARGVGGGGPAGRGGSTVIDSASPAGRRRQPDGPCRREEPRRHARPRFRAPEQRQQSGSRQCSKRAAAERASRFRPGRHPALQHGPSGGGPRAQGRPGTEPGPAAPEQSGLSTRRRGAGAPLAPRCGGKSNTTDRKAALTACYGPQPRPRAPGGPTSPAGWLAGLPGGATSRGIGLPGRCCSWPGSLLLLLLNADPSIPGAVLTCVARGSAVSCECLLFRSRAGRFYICCGGAHNRDAARAMRSHLASD
jgi:hypothetical protein